MYPAFDAGPSTDSGASDADAASVENLVANGDFEAFGCASWLVINGSVVADTIAHGGSGSCRFCTASSSVFEAYTRATLALAPGERFVATGWLRAAPGRRPKAMNQPARAKSFA